MTTLHDPVNPGDPMPMPVPTSPGKHTADEPGPREQAHTNAFELLVLAELARWDGDANSAVELTDWAAAEFDELGMHGPVIYDLIVGMAGDARDEARRRRCETEIDIEGFFAWLEAEPETAP